MSRLMSKTLFKQALECPTKIFYAASESLYKNVNREDSFLQGLADGGFQVGKMATLLYPTGRHVAATRSEVAVSETKAMLSGSKDIVLFEAAVQFEKLFARIDILTRRDNEVEIIEVKAKSYNSLKPDFEGTKFLIKANILPYLQDVAFQKYVLSRAYPELKVSCFLMMPDKAVSAIDAGLNQLFKIERIRDSINIVVDPRAEAMVQRNASLLAKVPVDKYVDHILANQITFPGGFGSFEDLTKRWSESYSSGIKIATKLHKSCSSCEYRNGVSSTYRSGFHECITEQTGLTREAVDKGTVLDLYNFRGKDRLLRGGKVKLGDVTKEDLKVIASKEYLTSSERQYMQCFGPQISNFDKGGYYFHHLFFEKEFSKWKFPFHMIDFETSTTAIPFYAGLKPFETVAFQYSHHIIGKNGQVRHAGQFILAEAGAFPNFEFIRSLQRELSSDDGTIFSWGYHENTVLNHIKHQLLSLKEPQDDITQLVEFISSITTGGDRSMVDLHVVARSSYFHPSTKGRTSIKKVLPAVLSTSRYLKEKYSKPVYGNEIVSLNFKDYTLYKEFADGQCIDPYDRLKLQEGDNIDLNGIINHSSIDDGDDEVADGGTASIAFARLQFENLDLETRNRIQNSLLRYCELDTLAMVMILEAWLDWAAIKLK